MPVAASKSAASTAPARGLTACALPWLARVIRSESRRYLKSFRAARRRPGLRQVHAVRIATRRVLASLSLAGAIYPGVRHLEIAADLQVPFKSCGRMRDLQLMERTVSADSRDHPEVSDLLAYIQARLGKQRQRLTRSLERAHPRRIDRALRELADAVEARARRSAVGASTAGLLARELQRSRRAVSSRRRRAVATNADSLHQARLAFKLHRYQLEVLKPLRAPIKGLDLRELRHFQTALGALTDRAILLRAIDTFSGSTPQAAAQILPYRRRIERERQRLVRRYLPELSRPERARSRSSSR